MKKYTEYKHHFISAYTECSCGRTFKDRANLFVHVDAQNERIKGFEEQEDAGQLNFLEELK